MLRNPCKQCLVRPGCSITCDEKNKRDRKLECYKLPYVLVFCFVVLVVLMLYSLFLLCLLKAGIISKKKFNHHNPFYEMDQILNNVGYDEFY
jgi:hypothetical protein